VDIVSKAYSFAKEAHKNQLDDDGLPYINHPQQVANIIKLVTADEDTIAAAYLHDTIENCGVTPEILEAEFNHHIACSVMEVTHEGKKDNYGYYFPRLKSKETIIIKLADRLSNISRMNSWDTKRQQQYLKNSRFWKTGEDKEK
jgi:GTP pyrophosphokinase